MSWLFGKGNSSSGSSIPPSTPLQQLRLKQIKGLHSSNQNVTEIERDNEYRVTFQSGGQTVSLTITLPPQFPHEKPLVKAAPANMKHSWLSDDMRVIGCYQLNSFYMHSDLGKTIHLIVQEFKKTPPVFTKQSYLPPVPAGFAQSSHTYGGPIPTIPAQAASHNVTPTEGVQTGWNVATKESDYPPPYTSLHKVAPMPAIDNQEIQKTIQKIQELSNDEMSELLRDDLALHQYVKDMEVITNLQEDRTILMQKNEELARENASKEPELDDLKGQLKEAFEAYQDVYNTFQGQARKQEELSHMYDIGAISTNLRISVLQSEEESEKIADEFLQGDLNLDVFMNKFMEKRKECHLRRAKEERLKCVTPY